MSNDGTIQNTGGGLTNKRVTPSPSHLTQLVEAGCSKLVSEGKPFTAYSVTQLLRDENPGLNIVHALGISQDSDGTVDVQDLTHNVVMPQIMAGAPQLGITISTEQAKWGDNGYNDPWGQWAYTYVPTKITVSKPDDDKPQVKDKNTGQPQLPANVHVPENTPPTDIDFDAVWEELDD